MVLRVAILRERGEDGGKERKKEREVEETRVRNIYMPYNSIPANQSVPSLSAIFMGALTRMAFSVFVHPEHTRPRGLYLFVEAAEVSVLPHAVQDLRCCFHHFGTMSRNSAERKRHIQNKARPSFAFVSYSWEL